MKKLIATHLLAAYLGAGIFSGTLLAQAIPALNIVGIAYNAVMWPAMVYCAPVARDCDPLGSTPEWMQTAMFTFN